MIFKNETISKNMEEKKKEKKKKEHFALISNEKNIFCFVFASVRSTRLPMISVVNQS